MTPPWLEQYASGQTTGYAQAFMSYAEYYGVDGPADDDPEIEERIAMHRQPIVGYASRTGTRRNLAALKGADWRLLVSAKGELRTEGFVRYALDNGAWTAYQKASPSTSTSFLLLSKGSASGPIGLSFRTSSWAAWPPSTTC